MYLLLSWRNVWRHPWRPAVILMAVGSVFAAMNTMYAAVARRAREIPGPLLGRHFDQDGDAWRVRASPGSSTSSSGVSMPGWAAHSLSPSGSSRSRRR